MLDLKFIRNNIDEVKKNVEIRGYDVDLSRFEAQDTDRRDKLSVLEELRHKRNRVSEEIAQMKKNGEDASGVIAEMKEVSSSIKTREQELVQVQKELEALRMVVPNMLDASVPLGKDEADNPVLREWGEIREMDFEALPHWDIGKV